MVTDFSAVEEAALAEAGKMGSAAGRFLNDKKKKELNKKKKKKKKKNKPNYPVPEFPWDELPETGKGIRRLIEQAEKGYFPSNGIEFKYDDVELIHISNFSTAYINLLEGMCDDSIEDFEISDAHELYYEYVLEMIQHYRDNKEYWRK